MTVLFLVFGYMGVPVAFALMAGVLVAMSLTPISMQSMIGQMFHGIDSETLLAVPFFLLVGELMTSANVTHRMVRLAQTLVGHMRGGLAQVVTLVQHVLRRHFRLLDGGRGGAEPHRRAGDGQGRLRPRLHRSPDRLRLDDGQSHSA